MEWKEVRLGDVCEIYGRIGFRGYTTNDLVDTPKEGAISLSPKNIINGELNLEQCTYIKWDKYYESPEIMINPNEIIITKTGSSVGRTTFVRRVVHPMTLNPQLVVLKNISENAEFLSYYIKSAFFQSVLKSIVVGSAIPTLSQKNLANLIINVPKEVDDQHRITSILSSLDRKIELNNKINADLEEMAQAIFKNWFVDFEPFKDGRFVDSELGMIPEGWKVGSPYEYAKVVYGAPYKSAKFNDNGEGLPLIRIRDLKDCNPQFYTPEILPQTEYVNMGDIVAGMDAEFVPHIWKGNTGLLNQRVCKLMPQQTSISNLFVLYLMKPELEFVQSYKTGTTVSHLGKADIDKFVVVLPPLEVVEECSKILDSILQRIKNISAESRTLSTLRDTLLPRLMSGEIEVPE